LKFDWLLLAQFAEVTSLGTMNIVGAGVDSMYLARDMIPAKGEIYVAARVVGTMDEWRQPGHRLETCAVGPDGRRQNRRLSLRRQDLPPMIAPGALPGELLAVPHRLELRSFGTYRIEISLDDGDKNSWTIAVRDASPNS
jgi:hypothetical protein